MVKQIAYFEGVKEANEFMERHSVIDVKFDGQTVHGIYIEYEDGRQRVGEEKAGRIRDCDINEIRDFIVGSNLEQSFLNQCSKEARPIFEEWLGETE